MRGLDNSRFEQMDKAALFNALLALKTCPKCRIDLEGVGTSSKRFTLWFCPDCETTWRRDNELKCDDCGGSQESHGTPYCACGDTR